MKNSETNNIQSHSRNTVLCAVNHFAPASSEKLMSNYKGLRNVNEKRDNKYSPLYDSIMSAIYSNLKEYNPDELGAVWTSSIFPERLTKEILRLVEQQIQRGL